MTVRRFPTHTDERGRLLVAEGSDIGFPVQRVFAITGAPAGAIRGEHVVPCRQVMVLVSGTATVWTAPADTGPQTETRLEAPGDAVDLNAGDWVRYTLPGPDATVIVFAEAAYRPRAHPDARP
ncbi:MAG: putative 3,4 keto-isomerase [Schumannella sp.]|nr:putative 3,4 keto-isomerase [Schumannella sp.]